MNILHVTICLLAGAVAVAQQSQSHQGSGVRVDLEDRSNRDITISGTNLETYDPYYCAWNLLVYGDHSIPGVYRSNKTQDPAFAPFASSVSPISVSETDAKGDVQVRLLSLTKSLKVSAKKNGVFQVLVPEEMNDGRAGARIPMEITVDGGVRTAKIVFNPNYHDLSLNGPLLSIGAGASYETEGQRLAALDKIIEALLPKFRESRSKNPANLDRQILNICDKPNPRPK